MDIVIPIIIVAFVVLHVLAYAFAILIRRHVMLPAIERFLSREDASLLQKSIVVDAFHDAVSVMLPMKLLRGHLAMRRQKEAQPKLQQTEKQDNEEFDLLDHCSEPTAANAALNEILFMMFKINRKFNIIFFIICALAGMDFKKVALNLKQLQEESGPVYVDIKHQHQH